MPKQHVIVALGPRFWIAEPAVQSLELKRAAPAAALFLAIRYQGLAWIRVVQPQSRAQVVARRCLSDGPA